MPELSPAENNPSLSGFTRSAYGVLLKQNWFDATFHFCSKGSYDRLLVDHLHQQQTPFIFLDIGANQGLYSILACQNPYCKQVFAFEPVEDTFALLASNLAANGVSDSVKAVKAAVSMTSGSSRINKKPWHSGAASLRQNHQRLKLSKWLPGWIDYGEYIMTLGPSELRELVPFTTNLIIKIDVEGHEQTVINALIDSELLTLATSVFYEVNPKWSNASVLESLLRSQGFTGFSPTSDKPCHDVLATRAKNWAAPDKSYHPFPF